ncbi:Hypothetical protein ETEE_3382 [Edwardsiella anguillarum ET080813]|uniref:Uncharacterized protein n=1 Tax=Edwardsiella anguillarum ET080813 TaxID=667120 RepID=A0A076LWF4_9GAMM|nr:Hypothetical protein ETEE_3382 [Edwardsiella anguillarum ET080813]
MVCTIMMFKLKNANNPMWNSGRTTGPHTIIIPNEYFVI